MIPSSEWILLFLIGVAVIKPEDLPSLAKSASQLIKLANKLWKQITILNSENIKNYEPLLQKKHPFSIDLPKAKIPPHKD